MEKPDFIITEGNLFEAIDKFEIDGIFAPFYSHRSCSIKEYFNKVPSMDMAKNILIHQYFENFSYDDCKTLYNKSLDSLVQIGAKRIATYPVYVNDETGQYCDGKKKTELVKKILEEWFEKNKHHIQGLYFFYF